MKRISPYDANLRNHQVEGELDDFFNMRRQAGIVLQRMYPPTAFPGVRSRLGGLPQLPEAFEWPVGESYGESAPMHFLAQIDCSELPRINSLLPTEGILFFFAVNDEEQIWDTSTPRDRVRVIYAQNVPDDLPMRAAPEGLRPINDVVASHSPFMEPQWLLPGENGPRLHVQWPLVARRMDTWPDMMEQTDQSTAFDYATYQQRLSELRLGAAVAATGLMPPADSAHQWERPISPSWTFPIQWLRYQKDFPQVGVIIDRLARIVANARNRQSRELAAHQDVLAWIERAHHLGWDSIPADEVREEFREWIISQIGGDEESVGLTDLTMGRIFTKGLLSAIQYVASSPYAASLIPASIYRDLEIEHLPYVDTHGYHPDGRRRCAEVSAHQMLGHAQLLQGVVPDIQGDPVCLLQLASDPAIDLRFGDCGRATFWIAREDLVARNFDRVEAVVESH